MKSADYKCESCNHITEIWIKDMEDFTEYNTCYNCGKGARRKFSPLFKICHQGKCGNSKNGYTSNEGSVKKT